MNLALRIARFVINLIVDGAVSLCPVKQNPSAPLVLVRLDAIGDFTIWLDAAQHFRRLYPNNKITLVTSSTLAELARTQGHWDFVIGLSLQKLLSNPIYRYKALMQIRRAGFQTAIQPTKSRVFASGDAVVRATGARYKIGSIGDLNNINPWLKRWSDRWYTRLINSGRFESELLCNAEFITQLSAVAVAAAIPNLEVAARLPLTQLIEKPYFIVFPGASWAGRQWPAQKFAKIINLVVAQYDLIPVLCGGANEVKLCASVSALTSKPVINFGGQTSLSELVELLRGATLLISNETSTIHFAAAVNVPSVCIVGGGHFGRFVPYPESILGIKPEPAFNKMACFGCNWLCQLPRELNGPVACIASVDVGEVKRLVDKVLANTIICPKDLNTTTSADASFS